MTPQRLQRLTSIGGCLIAVFAITAAAAQAGSPRWYGQETGSLVPFNGDAGLVELESPERLTSMGLLEVEVPRGGETMVSNCLVRDRESIENPQDAHLPGTGAMEEFEIVCEVGTGAGNFAAPFPCVQNGEAFELKGLNLDWPSMLEVGRSRQSAKVARRRSVRVAHKATPIRALPRYEDKFRVVNLEIYCLKTKAHGIYKGSLMPELEVGRLLFHGPESGELTEGSSGQRLSFRGNDVITPEKYKDIRVNSEYHERPIIASLSLNHGAAPGGTQIGVHGRGFAPGTSATVFDFGTAVAKSVNCTSTTECIVTTPAHAPGTVDVKASVNNVTSAKNAPADQFTYE
jgi:hypothetical protein